MNPDPTAVPKPISSSDIEESTERHWFKQQWTDNHGNFLIAFVIGTVLVNAGYVAYQQAKFVPPKFPDTSAFENPASDSNSVAIVAGDSVTFRVIGAPTLLGSVVVSLYNSSDSLAKPELALETWTVPLQGGIAEWSVTPEQLPKAFAAVAFHDENGDGGITQNSYGVPIERYGYTGNQRFFEPGVAPSYEQTVIDCPAKGGQVEIFIR
jgi:uncharacterized protein (DUF2141 family)